MSEISDFGNSEQWVIKTTLRERYGEDRELQFADAEIRLSPHHRELTMCPVAVWEDNSSHFVVIKTGDQRYRAQFFFRGYQQYGTGVDEYDNLGDCVIGILRAEADKSLELAEEAEQSKNK